LFIYLDNNEEPINKLNEALVESQFLDLNVTGEGLKSSVKKEMNFA